MVAHPFNLSMGEAEAGGSLQDEIKASLVYKTSLGQPGLVA